METLKVDLRAEFCLYSVRLGHILLLKCEGSLFFSQKGISLNFQAARLAKGQARGRLSKMEF